MQLSDNNTMGLKKVEGVHIYVRTIATETLGNLAQSDT